MPKIKYGIDTRLDRLYKVWCGIIRRCYWKDTSIHSKYYKDKGIKVCDEWKNDYLKFKEWSINNGYDYFANKGQCVIDRINPNGDYEPSNCRWISCSENSARVKREKGVIILSLEQQKEVLEKRKRKIKIKDLAKEYNVSISTIKKVIRFGGKRYV